MKMGEIIIYLPQTLFYSYLVQEMVSYSQYQENHLITMDFSFHYYQAMKRNL